MDKLDCQLYRIDRVPTQPGKDFNIIKTRGGKVWRFTKKWYKSLEKVWEIMAKIKMNSTI